ncbi:MAG: hypothetical protein ACTHOC_10705 [Luteimonas sp.]
MKGLMLALLFLTATPIAYAQNVDPPKERSSDQKGDEEVRKKWGLGLGLGVEQFQQEYVESASLQGADRIVTLERSYKTKPSAWLTGAWNIWSLSPWVEADGSLVRQTSVGIFAGVKLLGSGGDTFSAFSIGPQVHFELPNNRSVSVGVGWVTHGTRTFANGIADGSPLPLQYDNIVYRESTESSYMLMVSYGL